MIGIIAQEWLQQGLQQGEQRGEQQGLQQGEQRGEQQGLQQGEQRGEQRGLRRGLLDGIELALQLRFGLDGLWLLPEITKIEDAGVLKAVHEAIRSVERPEELRQFYAADERPESA